MAQIRKRGKSSYQIVVYKGLDAQGERDYYYETFYGSAKDARLRGAELDLTYKRPSPRGPKQATMTIGEYLQRWLVNVEGTVSDRTLKTYALHVKHLIAAAGDLVLYGLVGFDLKVRVIDYFKRLNLAAVTVKGAYGTFRTALKAAKTDGVIKEDLAASLKPPRVPRKQKRVLVPDELRKLLVVAREYKHGLIIRILALFGLRLGEALGLEWKDMDLARGTLSVRQSVDLHTREINDRLKTEASRRTLILDQETIALLAEHKREQAGAKVVALQGLVFRAENGKPLREMAVRRTFNRILAKAGLAHIRVHDLRHTAGSLLLDAGQPLATVSAFLGHSSTATTAAIYTHPVRKGASLADVLNLDRKES